MTSAYESRRVVIAAFLGNLGVAVTKFVAAAVTGSSAMLSEGVHSLVDTINESLLLHGMKQAAKPADADHPFGYGRELYFWSFIVSLLVLALGAGVSFYEGISHLRNPHPVDRPWLNYVVLLMTAGFEASTWWVAFKSFTQSKGDRGYFRAFRDSKDPAVFTVLFEDSAALLGLLIAFLGVAAAHGSGNPRWDGWASLGIGAVLATTSLLLLQETKALLIGEGASCDVRNAILKLAEGDPAIRKANGLMTVQLGPEHVVVAMSVEFEDELATSEIEASIYRIEWEIRRKHPSIRQLYVKPQTPEAWTDAVAGRPGSGSRLEAVGESEPAGQRSPTG